MHLNKKTNNIDNTFNLSNFINVGSTTSDLDSAEKQDYDEKIFRVDLMTSMKNRGQSPFLTNNNKSINKRLLNNQ